VQRLTAVGNRMFRKIFGPKTEAVRADWRKLHSEELHGLYTSVNTTIKSSEMRWMGGAVCVGQVKCVQKFRGET
jgi:hypothetical protein